MELNINHQQPAKIKRQPKLMLLLRFYRKWVWYLEIHETMVPVL